MHEYPGRGDVDEEEVCRGVGERNGDKLVGGSNRDDCIVV